ncbi:hypothetical protein [Natrinema pallidum]|uniref:Type II toxin-antitoxin system VapC family toxin n=1 Tax=Natrinema pallidum TaxID=69527 RepID=A0A4P9TM76_9EURY|nr:hypothetical protein [Natrinema pallidum]QCW05312.1 hypothetical protein FGF80_18910 [Natrinema pallidum]
MLILDSNLWIHSFTIGDGYPDDCIERLIDHRATSAVNAYIYREVVENIDDNRDIPRSERDDAIHRFSRLITDCPKVENCTQQAIERMDLEAERDATKTQMLGDALEIQPKDVPVFALAYHNRDENPTIYTDDESFAALVPQEYGFSQISIEHVPVSWERVSQTVE